MGKLFSECLYVNSRVRSTWDIFAILFMQMIFRKQWNAPINIVGVWYGKSNCWESKNMACPSYAALVQRPPSTSKHAAQKDPQDVHESQPYTLQHRPRSNHCKTLMMTRAPRLSNRFSIFSDTRCVRRLSVAEEREVIPSCPSSPTPLFSLEETPQVPWLEALRRQVQHHGKGSSLRRDREGET